MMKKVDDYYMDNLFNDERMKQRAYSGHYLAIHRRKAEVKFRRWFWTIYFILITIGIGLLIHWMIT
jgi:hypothetical protein